MTIVSTRQAMSVTVRLVASKTVERSQVSRSALRQALLRSRQLSLRTSQASLRVEYKNMAWFCDVMPDVMLGTDTDVMLGTGTDVTLDTGTDVTLGTGTDVTLGTGTDVTLGTGADVTLGTKDGQAA